MAFNFSPKIITDGLVVYLDAANPKSYAGSETVWNDLSGNGVYGTLTNGATFNSENNGSIAFDGVDDFVSGSLGINLPGQITVSAWINHDNITAGIKRYVTIINQSIGAGIVIVRQSATAGELQFLVRTDGTFKSLLVSNQLDANIWYYIVGTWDGTNMIFYKNATEIATSTPGGTMLSGNNAYNVSAAAETMNGKISSIAVYNRALIPQEVLQNFNATRSRYGI